ncbi:MAG: glycosyltransferase family 4 protein [Gammaproteobacteria bacterium]
MDIPNQRSSHDNPVPRGGGLAIVVIVLSIVLITGLMGYLDWELVSALVGGGGLVALIGWIDDHKDVPAHIRLVVHFLAAIWTVFFLGGFTSLELGPYNVALGDFGSFIAVLALVWMTNLYNFMDGTDGFAAAQTISVCVFMIFLFASAGEVGLTIIMLAMAAATTGFLFWNWAPAKIFMGDVGSSFLGYFFASVAIIGENTGVAPIIIWSILLTFFLWDATLTLIQRIFAGEKWYSAHRSHAYQMMVQRGFSHQSLALYFCVISVTFLWPMAWFAMNYQLLMTVIAISVSVISIGLWNTIRTKGRNNRGD